MLKFDVIIHTLPYHTMVLCWCYRRDKFCVELPFEWRSTWISHTILSSMVETISEGLHLLIGGHDYSLCVFSTTLIWARADFLKLTDDKAVLYDKRGVEGTMSGHLCRSLHREPHQSIKGKKNLTKAWYLQVIHWREVFELSWSPQRLRCKMAVFSSADLKKRKKWQGKNKVLKFNVALITA